MTYFHKSIKKIHSLQVAVADFSDLPKNKFWILKKRIKKVHMLCQNNLEQKYSYFFLHMTADSQWARRESKLSLKTFLLMVF